MMMLPPRKMCLSAATRQAAPPVAGPPPPQAQAEAQAEAQAQPQQQQQQQQDEAGCSGAAAGGASGTRDYTQVPKELDRRFLELDTDNALRPTIIKPSNRWMLRAQKALLGQPTEEYLGVDAQRRRRNEAFDLLDAVTRSGALPIDNASLHVVVAATHCFEKAIMETVLEDNINPIDKVERSTLIMASTVHQLSAAALIRDAQRERLCATSPMLFVVDGAAE
eukprot:NODE_23252_length_674_cov_4.266910.p1 GENE.NODE_23252_length_674_cov_4.266910~~NODE_23252_length_674_cov_4.266910.p1  ORF type:complete len:222 (+),score=86.15 NODE_23252_length_674_cov_4.266910:2-667(+)